MTSLSKEYIEAEICRFLSDMLSQPVGPHDELRARGLDSIGFLELIIFIEKQLRIPFPIQLMTATPLTTAQALAERVVVLSQSADGVN
jgi:acyl carrier protein